MPSPANPFLVPLPASPPPLPVRPPSFGRRAAALALDHLVLLLCLLPGSILIQILGTYAATLPGLADEPPAELFGIAFEAAFPVFLGGLGCGALLQLALLATQSRSLGKRWLRLRIVRRDGRPVGAFRVVVVRTPLQLLNYAPVIGQMLFLANLILAFRSPPTTFHDRAADTDVTQE